MGCATDQEASEGFLGTNWILQKFIPNYATVAAPLTDLTRKFIPTKVQWSEETNRVFQQLKESLCTSPVLHSPCLDQPFTLQTDALSRGIGAVLSQISDQGEKHPIAYFSRKLLPREENYSTIEKECLAVKLGVQTFRVYLLG